MTKLYFFIVSESAGVLDRRFIACVLASAFLCALPPPPDGTQVRSINFVHLFACFHRYAFCVEFQTYMYAAGGFCDLNVSCSRWNSNLLLSTVNSTCKEK